MSYIDAPNKKQKNPHYEHRLSKLDLKDNEFTSKKFQRIRNFSTRKNLIESFKRIGMCLNNKNPSLIPNISDLDKVCFIVVNDYDSDSRKLGVGPLNDGYLVGLNHHRLGFKVFYLYNADCEDFRVFLEFLISNTSQALTVFYSGRDDQLFEGFEFKDDIISKEDIGKIISSNNNNRARLMFITDSLFGNSSFDIENCNNAVSFTVEKTDITDTKEIEKTHGILTYYFCKFINECPNITPYRLIQRMNPSLKRFNEMFICEINDNLIGESPIFSN